MNHSLVAAVLLAATLAAAGSCASRSEPVAAATPPAGSTARASRPSSPPANPAPAKREVYAIINGQRTAIEPIPMGEPAVIDRIIAEGKLRNQVMDHLRELTEVRGPRLTGSSKLEEANNWARDRFEAWGLQNARLEQWGSIPVRFDRGPSTGKAFAGRSRRDDQGVETIEWSEGRELQFTTLAWTLGTAGPVRGPVVKMPRTQEEFEAVKDGLAGAWVLIGPDPSGRQGVRSGGMSSRRAARIEARARLAGEVIKPVAADGVSGRYEGTTVGPAAPDGMPVVLVLTRAPDRTVSGTFEVPGYHAGPIADLAVDRASGAVSGAWSHPGGVSDLKLVLADGRITGTSTTRDTGDVYTVDATFRRTEPDVPTVLDHVVAAGPAGFISSTFDERVWTTAVQGWRELDYATLPNDLEVSVSGPDYEFLNSRLYDGLPTEVEFDLDHTLTAGPIPVYNTIAEIRGATRPDEYVIVSAHLDSWNGPGSLGVVDNGTGSSVTLEAARLLMAAGARPDRTILFILWTGEEQGLLGSRAWVDQHPELMDRISCVFVDDGGSNYEGGLGAADNMVPLLAAATAPVNGVFYSEVDKAFLDVNVRSTGAKIASHGGSDHASFLAKDVPGFFWDEIGRADYGRGWHTQFDRLDQAVPEYLMQSATCAAVTAYNMACAPTLLPREVPPPADPAQAAAAR